MRPMVWIMIAAAALLVGSCNSASADVITEFGGGYKARVSAVLEPICKQVMLTGEQQHSPSSPNYGKGLASCGGDNPAFIGWPIAWQSKENGKFGAFTYRIGWFHYSNWFDGGNYLPGGDRHETSMDLLAGTITFNWTKWNRGRRLR